MEDCGSRDLFEHYQAIHWASIAAAERTSPALVAPEPIETPTGTVLGYVVVDWNQASHAPDVDTNGLYTEREDAQTEAVARQAETDRVGRGERHTVAAVIEIEED